MTSSLAKLVKAGILGNNERMGRYILPHNDRKYYPLVDNKLWTQKILAENNIPQPKVYSSIRSLSQFQKIHEGLKQAQSFVVKPARGAMGNGIMVVEHVEWSPKKEETFIVNTKNTKMSFQEFTYYISLVLSGIFSLDGSIDSALIQQKIETHHNLQPVSYKGLPDIRVILFKGFPIMAMVRLPTSISGGRGNLHQGAIGCGIDLKTGEITSAAQHNRSIEYHSDFPDKKLSGFVIPEWDSTLKIAAQCGEIFPLDYIGVDVVVDEQVGPMVLEVNARPGLSIQIANQKGLLRPLQAVLDLNASEFSLQQKVEYSMEHF